MKRRKLSSSRWELQVSFGLISFIFLNIIIISTDRTESAIVPPPWSDPQKNPCASMPGGWQLLYWPPLKKCFKIFQVGYPCPETMELSPAANSKHTSKNAPAAECRCPPGTALSAETNKCHSVFERGPCKSGQFFSPMPEGQTTKRTGNRWGMCKEPSQCPMGMLFWPKDGKCYSMYTKGPCSKGKLLIQNEHGLAQCKCESKGELGEYFYETDETCHEHFTKGPCSTPGHLFLPGGRCDCMPNLPHYHEANGMCFELGSPGPCPPGHIFIVPDNRTANYKRAKCQCKEGYILWNDGLCYRLYTRGPCAPNEFLLNSTSCVRNFCGKNRLYFPEEKSCYRIGSQGPCDLYQVVVFDFTARPSIDGVSFNGMCGCSGVIMNLDQQCTHAHTDPDANTCESSPGMVEIDGSCYKLYSRGPCGPGQWLEPIKSSTLPSSAVYSDEYFITPMTSKAKCVCRPGYTSYETPEKGFTGCNAPTVGLARYLNRQKYQFGTMSVMTAPES